MAKPCTPHPIPQAAQLFELQTANVRGRGGLSSSFSGGSKGGVLFGKRIPPLYPPEKDEGRPPSTPDIAGLILERLHALRSVGAVYMASP